MKIAVVEKHPSNIRYQEHFNFDFDLYQLSSVKLPKVLKKDVDIEINQDDYDYIILVGSEAVKYFAKITSVTDLAGHLVGEKYIPLVNPSMLIFKPDGKPAFTKSLERLHDIISGKTIVSKKGNYLGIEDTDQALEYLKKLDEWAAETGYIVVDTETSALYPTDGYVLGISLCAKERDAAYISTDCIDTRVEIYLQYLFNKYIVVMHNAKFDVKMLRYHFNFVFPQLEDTMVLHYILDETQGSHGLKSLALKYTDFGDYDAELDTFKKEYCRTHGMLVSDFTYDKIPFEIMVPYACIDTCVTFDLYKKFKPLVAKNPKLLNLYTSLLMPAVDMLIDVELTGVPFDRSRLEFAKVTVDKQIEDAVTHLYSLPEVVEFEKEQNCEFNPNSVVQLRKLLFSKLKLVPINKKTGTGLQSTDAEVLEEMSGQHPVVDSIITIRKLRKIKNTYIDGLLYNLDADGFVRTGFNLTSTTSGRLSSSGKFNAQNIPRDSPFVKGSMKGTGKYADWKVISCDLKTGEVYFAAVLSGDKKLQDVFKKGEDFHSSIAKQVFDLPCTVDEVKTFFKDKRQGAKAVTFSILYGAGPQKVSDTVNKDSTEFFSLEDAQEAISLYFKTFNKLKSWLKSVENTIKQQGFIYTSIGRKRRLKNAQSVDKSIAAHEIRSGVNAMVQAISSDINLFAAIDMNNYIKKTELRAKLFMLVHDSIVALVHPDDVEHYHTKLQEFVQKDRGFNIPGCPIGIDVDVGDDYSFGKFEKEVGEQYTSWLENVKTK